ncbi:hypothetical protein EVAR_38326_1 [Eumeta japonica]|uniref:Uncharacterized protein n=1 Tax=Eumeta variegata TaxID=151549 RepID=A0A4C1X7D7_EUMVA|nr:hypothetical protein EVAR_38326_1 [Eumeta japonica]
MSPHRCSRERGRQIEISKRGRQNKLYTETVHAEASPDASHRRSRSGPRAVQYLNIGATSIHFADSAAIRRGAGRRGEGRAAFSFIRDAKFHLSRLHGKRPSVGPLTFSDILNVRSPASRVPCFAGNVRCAALYIRFIYWNVYGRPYSSSHRSYNVLP